MDIHASWCSNSVHLEHPNDIQNFFCHFELCGLLSPLLGLLPPWCEPIPERQPISDGCSCRHFNRNLQVRCSNWLNLNLILKIFFIRLSRASILSSLAQRIYPFKFTWYFWSWDVQIDAKLFLDSAVIEIEPRFEERLKISLEKVDTLTRFLGSDCAPAPSFSATLTASLSMWCMLVKMVLVCKELHGTLGNCKVMMSQHNFWNLKNQLCYRINCYCSCYLN